MAESTRPFTSLLSFSGHRYVLIEQYRRLEDSVRRTFMPAFSNIEQRISDYAEELNAETFQADDPSFQEGEYKAYLYELFADALRAAQADMAGMAVAALYHHWERSVKWMLARDSSPEKAAKIEKADFAQLKGMLSYIDLPDECREALDNLDLGRLIANVVKHGAGSSADHLRQMAPDLFDRPWNSENFELPSGHGVNLIWVQPAQVDIVADAVQRFWETLPDDRFPAMSWRLFDRDTDRLNGDL